MIDAKFDPELFKQSFPLFNTAENRELIYLDNAATTQTLKSVIDATVDFYTHHNGNANRASHRLSRSATEIVEATRRCAGQFLGADANNIIFTQGATAGLNGLAKSLVQTLSPGHEILISEAEHHANFVPWQQLASQQSATVNIVPTNTTGIDLATLADSINGQTRILSISIGLNSLGCYPDMFVLNALLAPLKLEFPKLVIIFDASQYAAHYKIEADLWACDFLVCSAHKLYGPTGLGLVYGKTSSLAVLAPWQWGGDMVSSVTASDTTLVAPPHCFETGTLPLASIAGLKACLEWWQAVDRDALEKYERALTVYLHQQLSSLVDSEPELNLLTTAEHNVGIATISISASASFSVFDIAHWLDEHNIAVRAGKLCAQPMLAAKHLEAVLRLSVAAYNTRVDVDKTVHLMKTFLNQMTELHSSSGHHYDKLDNLDWDALISPQPWQSRYKQLMQWAEVVEPKPDICSEENRVQGCQTDVWLVTESVNDKCYFHIHTPSRLLRGFAAILLYHFQGKPAQAIKKLPIHDMLQPLGLDKQLSVSRNNGFNGLLTVLLAAADDYVLERESSIEHKATS